MLKIGLTGGIGSGKTTVSNLFEKLDIPIIDMDVIARDVVKPGQPALEIIQKSFGEDICLPDGMLDRQKLRDIIFSDEQERIKLENIIHPAIRKCVSESIAKLTSPYCIIVIPLLFETGQKDLVDRILVVDSSIDEQVRRTTLRDKISDEDARKIISSQVSREERVSKADDVIDNNGDKATLAKEISDLHQKYLELALKN